MEGTAAVSTSRPRVLNWIRRSFGGAFLALAGRRAVTDR